MLPAPRHHLVPAILFLGGAAALAWQIIWSHHLGIALGASAAQGLLGFGRFKTLGEVRGRWKEFAGKPVMVTYHPSYILRNPTNRSKRAIWEDLLQVMEKAALPISERQRGFFLDQ